MGKKTKWQRKRTEARVRSADPVRASDRTRAETYGQLFAGGSTASANRYEFHATDGDYADPELARSEPRRRAAALFASIEEQVSKPVAQTAVRRRPGTSTITVRSGKLRQDRKVQVVVVRGGRDSREARKMEMAGMSHHDYNA